MSGIEAAACCCGGLHLCNCPSIAQVVANCPEEIQVNIEGFAFTNPTPGSNPCSWFPMNISFPMSRTFGTCNGTCLPYLKVGNSLFVDGNRELIIYGCPSGIGDAAVTSLGCHSCSGLVNHWGFKLGFTVRQVAGNPSCNPLNGIRDGRWRVPASSSSPACTVVCPPNTGWAQHPSFSAGISGVVTVDF